MATKREYNPKNPHPNDYPIPCHYLCKKCKKVIKTGQGLIVHLVLKHKVRKERIQIRKHWAPTQRKVTS